jgi:hypothetical protein
MLPNARLGLGIVIACVVAACGAKIERAADSGASPTGDERGNGDAGVVAPPRAGECGAFSRPFGPVTLPSASKGATYEVRLREYADSEWWGLEYSAEDLPPGLELTSTPDPLLRGVPTSAGSFELTVLAIHGKSSNGCSTMPDPHTFRLDVADVNGGTDAGADAD